MVEFWAISFFYSCNHYIFNHRHIRNICHKSIWNFNEVFNSYFEGELGLYEIHLQFNSNGNENHIILDFIFESPFYYIF